MQDNIGRSKFKQSRMLRYPSEKQSEIWLKRRQGMLPSKIADQLDVTRAFVSKSLRTAETRIRHLMEHTAHINRVQVHHISSFHGFAVGYSGAFKSETIITYSPRIGVQVWFGHDGDCASCQDSDDCVKLLEVLASEWNVPLNRNAAPTKVANIVFKAIQQSLKWVD
ncbi:MAG: hypothetical protein ACFFEF_12680 [Candidatus Thorarchaeota archaeon]